jgi:predicted PurR-regulated permease PerM
MLRRIALSTAVVLTIAIGAFALWQMREALLLLVFGLLVAAGLNPLIELLTRRGFGRQGAISATLIGTLLLLIGAALVMATLISSEINTIVEQFPPEYEQLRASLLASSGWQYRVAQQLPPAGELAEQLGSQWFTDAGGLLLDIGFRIVFGGALIISVASLGFYLLRDQERAERLWFALIPLKYRATLREIWTQVYREVGRSVRGEAALVIITTAALLLSYRLLDLPAAALLAALGGLLRVIPILGLPLALAPALIVAAFQNPLTLLLLVTVAGGALLLIQSFVRPMLYRSSRTLNPVLTIIIVMVLVELAGLPMIIFATPLATAMQAIAEVLLATQPRPANLPLSSTIELTTLRERLSQLNEQIAPTNPGSERVTAMINRYQALLDEAEPLIEARTP